MPAPQGITVYVDNMCLEQVEADHYKGFDLRAGAIAYCHSGYRPEAVKQAYAQSGSGGVYLRNSSGEVTFQRQLCPSGEWTPANGFFPGESGRVVYS